MGSTSETSHAKNVANYERLNSFGASLGVTYNPTKANLKLTAINAQLTSAKAALSGVNSALPPYKNAVSARNAAFEPLSKLITRVSNALKASDTTLQTDEVIGTIIRKLQGRRVKPFSSEEVLKAAEAAGTPIVEVSSSQMSYDNRLDYFDRLLKQLSTIPAYNPNEADLKIAALTTVYNDLKAKNSAVLATNYALTNARILRNDILYKPLTGIVDTSTDFKNYIKSVYGGSSPQYKAVSGLKFVNYN